MTAELLVALLIGWLIGFSMGLGAMRYTLTDTLFGRFTGRWVRDEEEQ